MSSKRPLLIALHVGFVVAGMGHDAPLGPILPALTLRWDMSDVVAGSLFTAQFLSSMSATLVAPALAARIGARWALALGFTLLAVGIATIGVAPHWLALWRRSPTVWGSDSCCPSLTLRSPRRSPIERRAHSVSSTCRGPSAPSRWPLVVRALGTPASVTGPTAALAIACAAQAVACSVGCRDRFAARTSHSGKGAPRAETLAHAGLLHYALLYGTLIFLYVGTENSVAGWVAEFAHRMAAAPTATTWALAPTAFWAALTAGRLMATLARPPQGGHVDSWRPRGRRFGRACNYLRRDHSEGGGPGSAVAGLWPVGHLSAALGAGHAFGRRTRAWRRGTVVCCWWPRRRRYALGRGCVLERVRRLARRSRVTTYRTGDPACAV